MPTILTRLRAENEQAAGIAPIAISDSEIKIFRDNRVLRWWEADAGFSGGRWRCRKTDAELVSFNGLNVPSRVSSAALNNQAALKFGAGATNGQLYDGGAEFLPANSSFTVVIVARQIAASGVNFWQNADATTFFQQSTSGLIRMVVDATTVGNNSPNGTLIESPILSVASFDSAGRTARNRLNRGLHSITGSVPAGVDNENSVFHVGGRGSTATLNGGEIAAVMILGAALHLPDASDLLDMIEAHLGEKYGI